jgi:excisionase family DNA binding protein
LNHEQARINLGDSETAVANTRILFKVHEAARVLGIGRTLMYSLVMSGEVESVPIGRLRRIPASALTEYVQRLRATNQTNSPSA